MENTIIGNLELENLNNNLEEKQTNFLDSILGKAINTAADFAIRTALPDFIEEQVINLKDNLLEYGLKGGIKETINDAIDLGKSAVGLIKGKVENVEQMKDIVKEGGVIDGVSELWDFVINKAKAKGKLSNDTAKLLKNGKNAFLNNVESNINNSFDKQEKSQSKLEGYIDEWKNAFEKQDFDNMDKSFKKIEKEMKELIPLENIIKETRNIENLHTLIKNNGKNFNLNEEQLELAKSI